ncbi:hypothetical protein NHQ30_003028 [Ciborinia camelliae]|nr:hypothetical protein NHQ30_003028 [Ciborinia camelliae]
MKHSPEPLMLTRYRKACPISIPLYTGYPDASFPVLILPRYLGIQTGIIPLPSFRQITSSEFVRSLDIYASSGLASSTRSSHTSGSSSSSPPKPFIGSPEQPLYTQSPPMRISSPAQLIDLLEVPIRTPTPKPSLNMRSDSDKDAESSFSQSVTIDRDDEDPAICDLIQGIRKMII